MSQKFITAAASFIISLIALGAICAQEPSLRDQILAVDKELAVLRQTTLFDPRVKAAQAEVEAALARLKATEDAVLVRTNPKGKELVEKFQKLLKQYQAQQKAAGTPEKPKP